MKDIKKRDRAYLYFRENKRGYLNIKFGPEKYGHDTEKFYEILMLGLLQSLNFLSNLTVDLALEDRERYYNIISNTVQSILFEAFPDVKDKIFADIEMENIVAEAVETGKTIPVEDEEAFKARIEETKTKLKEQFITPVPLNDEEKIKNAIAIAKTNIRLIRQISTRLYEGNYVLNEHKKLIQALLRDEMMRFEEDLYKLGALTKDEED